MTHPDVKPVAVGDVVHVVNENYESHAALVTCVHGEFPEVTEGSYIPCINVVYLSSDIGKNDPYGRQMERMSSLQHYSQVQGMPRPGRYWENV